MTQEKQWKPSCITAFVKFAEGKSIDSSVSKGDYNTFLYFCQGMMWNLAEIKYSNFLVDTLEDFKNTGMNKKQDVSFIQYRLELCKEKNDRSNTSYDKVVRALIWRYDPSSPVNQVFEENEHEKKVDMACRLAGIIDSNKKELHPLTVNYIRDLDNSLMLSTAMCIRHILFSGAANALLDLEQSLFHIGFTLAHLSKATKDVGEIKNILAAQKDMLNLRIKAETQYANLYGSMEENEALRLKAPIQRRKQQVDKIPDFRDLATVEEATKDISNNSQRESWMPEDDD